MKKLCIMLARNNENHLRSSYLWSLGKGVSFAAMVAFLSNVFPVSAGIAGNSSGGKPNTVETVSRASNNDSTTSPVDVNASHISEGEASSRFAVSTQPVLVSALESNPAALRVNVSANTESLKEDTVKKGPRLRNLSLPKIGQAGDNSAVMLSRAGPQSRSSLQQGANGTNVLFGENITVYENAHNTSDMVAIGAKIQMLAPDSVAVGYGAQVEQNKSVVVGHLAYSMGGKSVAIGSEGRWNDEPLEADARTIAKGEESIAIGYRAKADNKRSVAFGTYAKVTADSGVAIGAESIADKAADIAGYTSILQGETKNTDSEWKSTRGAVSVGNFEKKITRQITGVAAGFENSDAVNVAQLKDLEKVVRTKGWSLSVGGENAQTVLMDSEVDFSSGSGNFKITKGDKGNTINFDLAKSIAVDEVKVGANVFDATGLVISNGPKVTTAGISAGSKKITDVAKGDADTDAVNVAQLKAVQEAVAIKGLKINTTSKDFTDAVASAEDSIAIGAKARTEGNMSIAIGYNTQTSVMSSVALGSNSNVLKKHWGGVVGYSPKTGKTSTSQDPAWRSGFGAVSVGKYNADTGEIKSTRQIVGVSAGTEDTDAVNVAQLKELREMVGGGWQFTIGGENPTNVSSDTENTVDFSSGSGNFKIAKGDKGNKLTFDLAKDLTLDSIKIHDTIKLGASSLSAAGLIVADGPKMTKDGISAGNKKITNLETGTADTDAVNFAQLKSAETKIEQQVAANSFVKQDANTKHITIGKGAGGDKIDIANNDKEKRTLTGIKDGALLEDSNEAVTGSQLYSVGNALATYLGGGAEYKDGKISIPTFKLKTPNSDGNSEEKTYTNVAAAFEGIATSITNVQNKVTEQVNNVIEKVEGDNLVQQNSETQHITIGKDIGGDKIDIANKDKEKRTLTGLKNGDLSEASSEAVTGSQLFTTNSNVTQNTNDIKEANSKITKNAADITKANSNISSLDSNISKYLGGGANVLKGTEPTYTVQKQTYHDVGSALAGVDSSFTNVNNKITKVENSVTNIHNEIAQKVDQNALLWSDEEQAFVAHHKKKKVEKSEVTETPENSKITFLANGDISAGSTDAINGSQLYSVGNALATYLGGGAEYKDGKVSIPTFKLKTPNSDGTSEEKIYKSVAEAFEGVGASITNVKNEITNQINNEITKVEGESIVKWDEVTKSITIGQEKDGSIINLQNKNKESRTIAGVIGGTISKDSNEAVNGSQLFDTNENVATYLGGGAEYKNGSWTAPKFIVKTVQNDGNVSDSTYNDVAAAFMGVGNSFKNVKNEITNVQKKLTEQVNNVVNKVESESFVQQDKATHRLTIGAKVAGGEINITNNEGQKRTITGIKDGALSADSSDAVTGSQLFATNADVTKNTKAIKETNDKATKNYTDITLLNSNVSTYLGGEANVLSKKAPTYNLSSVTADGKINSASYNDVGSAFEGLDTNIKNVNTHVEKVANDVQTQIKEAVQNINTQITNVTENNLIQHDGETGKITIGAKENGTEISILNKDGNGRTISGVKAAVKGDEAVNKTQFDEGLKNLSDALQSDESAVVHYDKKDGENGGINYASVTLGGKNKTSVALHNVADGKIEKNSHDAITGGQINTVGNEVAQLLGGDTSFKDGSFTGTTYNLSNINEKGEITAKTFSDVGSAFTGLNTNIDNVNKRIKEVSQSVAQDSLNWSTKDNAFVATHGEGEAKTNSKITHLSDGNIASDSVDAVTGRQLYSVGNALATYLGGDAEYKDGKWTAPTFKLKIVNGDGSSEEKTYHDVGSAFAGVDSSFTNVKKEITNQINNEITKVEGESLVKWDDNSQLIKIGAEKHGNTITISDQEGKDRTLSGVKKAEKVNEAVNKGQLDESLAKLSNSLQSDDSAVVHYDKKADDNNSINYASVTFGKGKDSAPVGLHNVAEGQISENSRDVINGGQINEISQSFASYLGGGTVFNNGTFTGPTYKLSSIDKTGEIKDAEFKDVGTAFSGLDENIKHVNQRIKEVSQDVAQDSLNWSTKDNAFVAQHEKDKVKTNSKITSLANGNITKDSTDAVNGSQLYSMGNMVATYFGGGSKYENGILSKPDFKINIVNADGVSEEKKYDTVADAFAGVGTSITNVKNEIKNEINEVVSDSLVKQEKEGSPITIGKETDGTIINLQNKNGENRTIYGVIGGAISKDSIEAVNGSQLFETNQNVAGYFGGVAKYENGKWTKPDFKVKIVNKDGTEVKEQSYGSVADAFAGVGSSFENLQKEFTQSNTAVTENIKQNALLWSDNESAFVAQHGKDDTKTNSKIKFLANGSVAKDSTDAINGSQLYFLGSEVAKSLGGNASYKDGKWTAPKFTVKTVNEGGKISDATYDDVTTAFAGVGSSFANVNNNITNKFNELTQNITNITQEVQGDALLWDKAKSAFVATHSEKEGEKSNSKITSLKNGDI
ncbi:hypothetical protein NPX99_00005, partial [Bartonella sp. 220]|uniref:hypothetical protein n=1 Tax=Bartonella sp. 220B TaxID=2967260 RepID=UPI0022A9F225